MDDSLPKPPSTFFVEVSPCPDDKRYDEVRYTILRGPAQGGSFYYSHDISGVTVYLRTKGRKTYFVAIPYRNNTGWGSETEVVMPKRRRTLEGKHA